MGKNKKNTFQIIYDEIKKIPKGCISTYGEVARATGNPRWARVVGYALHVTPENKGIPAHRVVNRFGETSQRYELQRQLLENEGVTFTKAGKVDLEKHFFRF